MAVFIQLLFVYLMLTDIHTLQGNSHGLTCSIPFKYNNKWFWDCTSEGREDRHLWCATTNHYDQDEKWGFCPNPGKITY